MKSRLFILSTLFLSALLFLSTTTHIQKAEKKSEESKLVIPEDVQKVIDNSCFGCHNSNSKNEKGKKKLSFDKMSSLETAKLIGELGEIAEVVEENEMPPAKFLEFKPEAKLTEGEKKALIDWAENSAESLLD